MSEVSEFRKLPRELFLKLVKVYEEGYKADPTYAYKDRKRVKGYLKWLLRRPNARFFVAFEGETPIGFVAVEANPPFGEVHEIVLLPAARGKGLGSALLKKALEYLRKEGCSEVGLWVGEKNERALRFYEKFGFRKTGKVGVWIRMEGRFQQNSFTNSRSTSKASSASDTETLSSGV